MQKAVVVVTDTPQSVGQLREKLSVVTSAWFAQRYVIIMVAIVVAIVGGAIWMMKEADVSVVGISRMLIY